MPLRGSAYPSLTQPAGALVGGFFAQLCLPHLERIHEDAEIRRADLMQLEQIASGYPSVNGYFAEFERKALIRRSYASTILLDPNGLRRVAES